MATSLTFGTYKSLSTFSVDSRHSEDRIEDSSTKENETDKAKANSSSSLYSVGKHGMIVTAGTAADWLLSDQVSKNLTKLGFCLGNYITRNQKSWFRYIGVGLGTLNARIGRIFGANISSEIMIPALCEEIEFRWFVQEVLLRKLPKAVLQKIAPNLTRLVDSFPARISRVAAVALFLLFATPML